MHSGLGWWPKASPVVAELRKSLGCLKCISMKVFLSIESNTNKSDCLEHLLIAYAMQEK